MNLCYCVFGENTRIFQNIFHHLFTISESLNNSKAMFNKSTNTVINSGADIEEITDLVKNKRTITFFDQHTLTCIPASANE